MKIAILWYGKEWKSTHEFLLKTWVLDEDITILDRNLDKNYLENLEKFDLIYKSPWISNYIPEIQAVKSKIKTQTSIFFERFNWKIILISWTKWKSTTASLIYEILKSSWKSVKLVWNIWNPILSEIDFDDQPEFSVFEISSYMLDGIETRSDYAILTNIYKAHTARHKTHENYIASKLNAFNNAKNIILRESFDYLLHENYSWNYYVFDENSPFFWFDSESVYWVKYDFPISQIKIKWAHNFLNISSILPICEDLNIPEYLIKNVLSEFNWIPHRQEFIWTLDWVEYYNDSISTIPESVLAVIDRFQGNLWTLILWWEDNDFDYSELIERLNSLESINIILLPDSFNRQKSLFNTKNIFEVENLEQALWIAKSKTPIWKACVLSPWAPSTNMFKNFEERWLAFKELIFS